MSSKIGLFYGSTTCYTEMAAEKIQQVLGEALIELHNIKDVNLSKTQSYDVLIFGISTWDFGELQEDWESSWNDLEKLDMSNKTAALFGLGDQIGYADWFQDALGMLHDVLIAQGCQIIGYWPNEGYEFNESKGLDDSGEFFVGLSLDDENQFEQTDQRIQQWTEQLINELAQG